MVASIIVLPAWLMFGRSFFGAPLGTLLLSQALLVPGLAILIGVVVGLTVARKRVRAARAVAWSDVAYIGPWLVIIALLGVFVVDSAGGFTASAASIWFGEGFVAASRLVAGGLGFVTIAGGLWLVVRQMRALAAETRSRLEDFAERAQQAPAVVQQATFEPLGGVRGPQSGRVISLDADEELR